FGNPCIHKHGIHSVIEAGDNNKEVAYLVKREDERNMSDDKNRGGASMAPIDKGRASVSPEVSEPATDDRLTYQIEAAQILLAIRDSAFDSNDQKLALALGRSSEEIAEWLNGEGNIDSDALLKAKALATKRDVELA
ncbi:MAG TPA: hypothetical protein VIJ87_16295, partial [Pyrinomonadaceae bacterium]